MSKNSKSLMLVTLVKSLVDIGYNFHVFTLDNGKGYHIWQYIGCHVFTPNISIDWSNYEGVILTSLEGRKIIPRLLAEPFNSVPLIWLIQEDDLGKRISQYAEWGWQDLISDWKGSFGRADVVVFPDFSLPMLYSPLDTGNFFVISGTPLDIWATKNYISTHSRNQLRDDYELAEDDLVILVIGSVFFYDQLPWDYAATMHALAHIINTMRSNDLHGKFRFLLLCGDSTDSYVTAFQEVTAHMGFPYDAVRYYGMDHDVNGFLLMSDIVIYGSFQEEQSFPRLLMQAMSFEVPIVAPNLTIITKYVADGVNGFIFSPGDPETMSRVLSLVVEDKKVSELAHKVASGGKLLSMNMLASDCILGYAKLLENVLQFPSDVTIPDSISLIHQKSWLWDLMDNKDGGKDNFQIGEYISSNSLEEHGIVSSLESECERKRSSRLENETRIEDFPTDLDWEDVHELEASEDYEWREMQELDERMEINAASWEEVYRNSRKAEKMKPEGNERDEGELERTGQSLCIYEIYNGEGTWPFLHHGSIYRGIALSKLALRPKSDDLDASSRLPVLNDAYYRDLLCEIGAMFAVANRVDNIHRLPWIGFQSWHASGQKVSLSSNAEKVLEETIHEYKRGDIVYFWAVMDNNLKNDKTGTQNDFWSMCDHLNAGKCRLVFEDAFRMMYGLPSGIPALPPMPSDGDGWSILHSWVMPTHSFLEFIMFSRIFADSLNHVHQNTSSHLCLLGSSDLEKKYCYCRVLEMLVNVWAYHSARRMVFLNPVSGELKEQHPLELREMWLKYFNSTMLKSMDEDLAEEADDDMHSSSEWLWPWTGEVLWQGILDREREDRYRRKMDKKRKMREKALDRKKHGYKQKSLGQKAKA